MDKKAIFWDEKRYYIACPSCQFVEEVGSIFMHNEGDKWVCEECLEEFEIYDCTD